MDPIMDLQPAHQTFIAESRELLQEMEQALLTLEKMPSDVEAINAVFRAAHTIKGSSGVFGFDDLVEFTHTVESLLEDVRAGLVKVDPDLIGRLLASRDHIAFLVDNVARGEEAPRPTTTGDAWHVSLRLGPDVLRNALDPLSFLRYLGTLGELKKVDATFDAMPELAMMDPESCYLNLEIDFSGAVDKAKLEEVFEFLRDDCEIEITPPHAPATRPGVESKALESNFVRVHANKLDELIRLVGELVIAGAGANTLALKSGNSDMIESTSTLERLVEEVRDAALNLRMVPIAETFGRFNRVVRDLGRELGKEVELTLSGVETEVDKSMAEKIADPLMHLVRNALDHGIESPEVRRSRGKPAVARLSLNAYHETGSIVVEVSDDGGGLDRGRILERAVERGLVSADHAPSDQEVFELIMQPGFSTAQNVTNVSGRGIGMDVVKRNVEALRGTIAIESIAGAGTKVVIRLPLTLAIIDGFLVGVGRSTYVVPLDMVIECMELNSEERSAIRGRSFINLRDKVLPLLRLRDTFEVAGEAGRRENIVVVDFGGRQAGLVVDSLQGEFQTVIKPLGRIFERLGGISGSTILGSGEVALILDVPVLVQRAIQTQSQSQLQQH
jgi:two-component system chemotaxis sensor kinase CheA